MSSLKDFQKQKKEFEKNGLKIFTDAVNKAFKDIPELKEIRWPQYTPYFNDGDPCRFRIEIDLFDWSVEDGVFIHENWENSESEDYDNEPGPPKELNEVIDLLCAEEMWGVLLKAYGDHVTVYATRSTNGKITIDGEDYEHD